MYFIGDVHGKFYSLEDLLDATGDSNVILLGDVGLGFRNRVGMELPHPKKFPSEIKFIRGNHDNPNVCKHHPNYLGDYGCFSLENHTIGFISGGLSIDKKYRTPNIDWWEDEELTYAQLQDALALFESIKPNIMISHEAPGSVVKSLFGDDLYPSRTNQFLDVVSESVKSIQHWVCGHYHMSKDITYNNIHFKILNELELYKFK